MRAAVYERYGGPERIAVRELPKPAPKPGEVLVRVHATSVNSWDWDLLVGNPLIRITAPFRPQYRILGGDVAGLVEAAGAGVTRFAPGDRVTGDLSEAGRGGFAEFVAAPAAAFARVPDGVSMEAAASVPHAALLALQALRDRRPVQAGEHVLINGACGGMGTFAIQFAKRMGAEVTAVDHGTKLEFVRGLGADHVIDYTREDFAASGRRYDRIVDAVARRPLAAYLGALAAGGMLVVVGGRVATLAAVMLRGSRVARQHGKELHLLMWRPDTGDMEEVLAMCAAGTVRPVIDRVYPLEETAEALRRIGEGEVRGKVIVRVAE